MSGKINLQEERFILAHGFRGVRLWFSGFIVSGPVLMQTVKYKSVIEQNCLFHGYGVRERRETETEREREFY